MKPKLLVLLGPTAVGKTDCSLRIAKRFNCEIISADSMQVYRGMDIGTAKIPISERHDVPHHLIDIRFPDEPYSAADFQQEAARLIEEIHRRGQLPFIVGGTGLYIEALCYGFEFGEQSADEAFRAEQQVFADTYGVAALHEKLRQIDPDAANRIHPNDRRRTIRALELARLNDNQPHRRERERTSPYDLCIIGLTMDRGKLYERINDRVDLMIEQGLVREVRQLLAQGYSTDLASMQGLGYKEICGWFTGQYRFEEAIELLKRNTRRYAKRQLSWFRHMNSIQWVDFGDKVNFSAHLHQINDIITASIS